MMLLGDVLLCPPVVTAPREKAPLWVCSLRQTTQVDHGAVAFAAAMRPSIEMASALPSDKSAVVPCVDGSGLARAFFTVLQHWSLQPCVRPFDAVYLTAGHNALRGSGPYQQLAFKNALAHVGCPDRRSTGSALRAVRPPNLHITPVARRDLVYRASATGSLYRSPVAIMAQTIRAILLASAIAATLVGRLASNAVSQGRCLVPWTLA